MYLIWQLLVLSAALLRLNLIQSEIGLVQLVNISLYPFEILDFLFQMLYFWSLEKFLF